MRLKTTTQLLKKNVVLFDHTGSEIRGESVYEGARPETWGNTARRPLQEYSFNVDWNMRVNNYTRRKIASIARAAVENVGSLQGMVSDIATYTVADGWWFLFNGPDKEWNRQAKLLLENEAKIIDMYQIEDLWGLLWMTMHEVLITGDVLWIFTRSKNNRMGMVQLVEGHLIDNGKHNRGIVVDGDYKGAKIDQGCIFDNEGRVIAYNLLTPDRNVNIQVSRRSSMLVYKPTSPRQYRGVSAFASVINDLRDYKDIRDFYKMIVKKDATRDVAHTTNRSVDDFATRLSQGSSTDAGTVEDIYGRYINGPETRLWRVGEGEDLKLFESNRPSPNIMEFQRHILQGIFAGSGWQAEMTDLEKLGGASARFILSKAQRIIAHRHQPMIYKLWKRTVAHQLAVAIEQKRIPTNKYWYMFEPTPTRRLTLDYYKDVKSDMMEDDRGYTNSYAIAAANGTDLDDNLMKKGEKWRSAKNVSEITGAPIEYILHDELDSYLTPAETKPETEEE